MSLNIIIEKTDKDTITISTNGNFFVHYNAKENTVVSALQDYITEYWSEVGQYNELDK